MIQPKIVVYTAIIGGVDKLIQPKIHIGAPLICFTDRDIEGGAWDIVNIKNYDIPDDIPGDAVSLSRYFKMLPHVHFPHYDYSIWIDGSDTLVGNPLQLIPFNEDWISFKHPHRDCIYQEFEAILLYKKDTKANINRLYSHYQNIGVPSHIGLAACSMIWRRHSQNCQNFCDFWWNEFISTNAVRDQPTWAYCNWKHPIVHRFLNGNHMRNRYVYRRQHVKRLPQI